MVYKCCVPGCKTYSAKDKMPFHLFPKDPERFTAWLKATKATVTMRNRNHYRICAIHFAADAKFPYNRNRTTLKANAVPTLHLPPEDLDTDKPVSVLRDHSYVIKDRDIDQRISELEAASMQEEEIELEQIFFNNENANMQPKSLAKVYPSARVANYDRKSATAVVHDAEINEPNTTLNTTKQSAQQQKQKDEESDESALFGELVAVRLRNLQQRTRKILMHKIDDLIFKTEMAEMDGLCNNNAGVSMNTARENPSSSVGFKMEF